MYDDNDMFWNRVAWASEDDDPLGLSTTVSGPGQPNPYILGTGMSEKQVLQEALVDLLAAESQASRQKAMAEVLCLERKYAAWEIVGKNGAPELDWSFLNRPEVIMALGRDLSRDQLMKVLLRARNPGGIYGQCIAGL